MSRMTTADTPIGSLDRSWRRYLRAAGHPDTTIRNYLNTLGRFSRWLEAEQLPTTVAEITSDDITDFLLSITDQGATGATAAFHYRNLCALYKWLTSSREQAIKKSDSPMLDVSEPRTIDPPRPAFTDSEVSAMIRACSGRNFHAVRDEAIIRLFYATGMRVSGMAGLRYAPDTPQLDNPGENDVFLDHHQPLVRVRLKGGRVHLVPIGARTVMALDRYLRVRAGHEQAHQGALWVGPKGPLASSGIAQMVKRRAARAGVKSRVHTHRFRRTLVTHLLDSDTDRTHVAQILGWTDLRNVALYASDTEQQRAWKAAAKVNVDSRV